MLIGLPTCLQERRLMLEFRNSKDEIVSEAVRYPFKPKKSMLECELPLFGIDRVTQRHAAKTPEPRIRQKYIKDERCPKRQKKRGETELLTSAQQTTSENGRNQHKWH